MLFINLYNIFCSIVIMYTFFNYNFLKKKIDAHILLFRFIYIYFICMKIILLFTVK